ncbi:hypothetical protein GQ457_02G002620 [Hibiscus cannabinus]
MGPSTRNMSILTNVSSNNRLPIVMVPEEPPQTESRMQIPRLFAGAEGAVQVDHASVPIVYRPPHPGFLEVLENPSEKHVISLLLCVNASRPIANFQTPSARWDLNGLDVFLLFRTENSRPIIEKGPGRIGPGNVKFRIQIRIGIPFHSAGIWLGERRGGLLDGIRAYIAFEAEIGVLEKDASVVEAWAADGELVEGGPAAGRQRR